MFRLKEFIHIDAPLDRCFLLSTSIQIVQKTLELNPVRGKRKGLIVNGDRLLWRGWKFGVPAWHETLITRYERPDFFQDTMGSGMFRHFQHDHRFQEIDGRSLLIDIVRFSMPLGHLGQQVGRRVVVPYVLETMRRRFQLLKSIAEGPEWEWYLEGAERFLGAPLVARESSGIQLR